MGSNKTPKSVATGKTGSTKGSKSSKSKASSPAASYSHSSRSKSSSSSSSSRLTGRIITVDPEDPSSAESRLSSVLERNERARQAMDKERAAVAPYLANRSYHLPGNGCCQDWVQYFTNNHPVLGLCCHHRLHPVGFCRRIVVLIGSVTCGLAVTNLLYLYFLYHSDDGVEGEFASIGVQANLTISNRTVSIDTVTFSNYQVTLWTLGAFLHSSFDLLVWYIVACTCCQPGASLECCSGLRWMGSYIVMFGILVIAAAGSFAVILRATIGNDEGGIDVSELNSGGIFDDSIELGDANVEDYAFLISWLVELALALFVYYFLIGSVLMSGCLGCGRLPILGGRPREMFLEQERELRRLRTVDSGVDSE